MKSISKTKSQKHEHEKIRNQYTTNDLHKIPIHLGNENAIIVYDFEYQMS